MLSWDIRLTMNRTATVIADCKDAVACRLVVKLLTGFGVEQFNLPHIFTANKFSALGSTGRFASCPTGCELVGGPLHLPWLTLSFW